MSFLLGNYPYFEILGKKYMSLGSFNALCQKMYFALKNSSVRLDHFWELASSHVDLDGSIRGSINRIFSQFLSRCLSLSLYSN
jgi:hypothetical protein